MAIVESMWLKNSRKRLGNTVVYQAMGQTRQRELASHVTNPRTNSQMTQRVKWANLVNFYRTNRSWMKYAFETKKSNQSEYNKLMSLNVSSSNIYLPKQVAAAGGCVISDYMVTQGSLPSIESIYASGSWVTNIVLQPSFELQEGYRVSSLSRMLLEYNPALRSGDQLSFIRMTQQTNGVSGVPYIVVREYEMLIDLNDESEIQEYLPLDYIGSNGSATDCRLIVKDSGNAGGFVLILSRTISGKTYVSSQRVIVANNEAITEAYSGLNGLQTAIDSYGMEDDAFLSTVTANKDSQAPVILSILSLYNDGSGTTVAAGGRFDFQEITADDEFTFLFNGDVPTGTISATVYTNKGSVALDHLTKNNNQVIGSAPDNLQDMIEVVIMYATVTIAGIPYRIDFEVRNSDTQGGLE